MRNDLPNENASNFSARIRETLMTYLGKQGDPLDRGVTLRDLVQSGFVTLTGGRIGGGPVSLLPGDAVASDTYEPDLTPPPTPSGLTVTPGITYLFIEHDNPQFQQGHGYLRTHVYGAIRGPGDPVPVFADAAEVAQFSGTTYGFPTNPATTWHIWIKWETVDGVLSPSPAGGINGVSATTGQDVALLLEALTGEITQSQLYADLGSKINLIDAADTVAGSVNARVKGLQEAVEGSLSTLQAQVSELQDIPAYSNTTAYATGDLVSYDGGIYQAKQGTTGNLPTNTTYWLKVGDYASIGQVVASHTTQISNVVSDLAAEVSLRQTLDSQVNNADTGLPATRANLATNYYTKTAADTAISTATSTLVSTTALNTALGSYATTATLTNNYYTKTDTNSAISTATQNLISNTALTNALGSYATTATLTNNYYTKSDTNSAISTATQNLISNTALTNALGSYTTTASLQTDYYTKSDTNSAISTATQNLISNTALTNALGSYATTATLTNNYYTKSDTNSAISTATQNLVSTTALTSALGSYATTATLTNNYYTKTDADSAISTATQNLVSTTALNNALGSYATTATLTNNYYTKTATDSAISTATTTLSASTGKSGNMVDNSEFALDLSGWTSAGAYTFSRNLGPDWTLAGTGTAYIHQNNQTDTRYDEAYTANTPVLAGKFYEWSIYTGAHRCTVEAFIYWYNSSGNVVGNTALSPNAAEQAGGPTLAGYKRLHSIGQAPAGTTYARGVLRKGPTYAGQGDSWAFFTYAFFGEAGSQQTTPSAYSPGGLKNSTSALQISASTTANAVTGLSGQYTVKVDLNGYVSGFGLASTATTAAATSTFGVRADSFYVASPTGPGITPMVPFIVRTTSTTINGVTVPAGVYINGANIQGGSITGASIAGGTIAGTKLIDVSANKITGAALLQTSYIESYNYVSGVSGWKINGNGVAEFPAATIRGQLTAGQIQDATISTDKLAGTLSSTNYSSSTGWQINKAGTAIFNQVALRGAINGGAYTAYSWPASGTGFHLGPSGLLLGNYNTGKYFQVEANGDVYAPGFSIVNGAATFSGSLSAATGTFSGSLTAQVVNTANIVGAAVTSSYVVQSSSLTASVVFNIPTTGYNAVTVVASLGQKYVVTVSSGTGESASSYSYIQTVSGELKIDGATKTGQDGTLIYVDSGSLSAGNHTATINRDAYSGNIYLSVLVTKR